MMSLQQQIDIAVQLLNKNDVVAMPTETVYGLAAKIDSDVAIKKIFSTKERPFFDPLIVHVASIEQAKDCASEWNKVTDFLAKTFWPGPLTLVLPKAAHISDLITAGLPSVGLRWPQHPTAQELIKRAGVPLAAPSANKFGRTSPTKFQHVKEEFLGSVFVVEGDQCAIGIESTVLSVKKQNDIYCLAILRKGAILKSVLTQKLESTKLRFEWVEALNKQESPGQMQHHYMPSIPFIVCRNSQMKLSELSNLLNQRLAELPDVVEGVKIIKPKTAIKKIEFLKLSENPVQAAREIYSQLRAASLRSPDALCFIQTSAHSGELWESVFDRLYKAASLILD